MTCSSFLHPSPPPFSISLFFSHTSRVDKSRQWSVESFFQNYVVSTYYCKIITNQSSAHFLSRTRARCAHEKEIERLGPSDRLRKRERERQNVYIFFFSFLLLLLLLWVSVAQSVVLAGGVIGIFSSNNNGFAPRAVADEALQRYDCV